MTGVASALPPLRSPTGERLAFVPPARPFPCPASRLTLCTALVITLWLTSAEPLRAQPTAPPAAPRPADRAEPITLTLRTPLESTAVATQSGRELLITLRGPLPELDLPALQAASRGRVESVRAGYDTLLLVLAPGVTGHVEAAGDRLAVVLRIADLPEQPGAAGTPSTPEQAQRLEQEGGFRLGVLSAQLAQRTARTAEARSRYEALHAEAPQRAEPLAGLAALDQQSGFSRRSLSRYAEASQLAESPELYRAAVQSIERAQAPGARIDAEHRRQRNGGLAGPVDLDLLRASAQQRLGPAWRLGGSVEGVRARTDAVLHSSGAVEPFTGWRERAQLQLQHESLAGLTTSASLYAQHNDLGFGLNLRQVDDQGATTLNADLRRPNWDYVEGIVERALRDRVSAARLQRFAPNVLGQLELGLNRYRFPALGNVARSSSLLGELRWTGVGGVTGLTATYGVDGEYSRWNATRAGTTGVAFQPLALLDREVHTLTLGWARTLGDIVTGRALTVDIYAGYGKDRYARSGPLAAGALTYVRGALEFQLRAGYVRDIGRERSTTRSVAATVALRLP